eukprot:superscaffoldBa00001689_g11632
MQAETEKLEAVEIAEALLNKVEELQSFSEECSAESWLLSVELKSEKAKQDQLHYEILELQQMLQDEKDLRNQADANNLKDFELAESICQELDHQLQRERELMEEAQSSKVEAKKIEQMLFQQLEEARTVTEKLSAESQTLADKLRKEEKRQEALLQDITELMHLLDKETMLRVQAENYELEAIKVVEVLQKRLDRHRARSSARTRTSCGSRSFFCCFRRRATKRKAED